MKYLRKRIKKLENIAKVELEETLTQKTFKYSDWTNEELEIAIACFDQEKPLPPGLDEKARNTIGSSLAGLSEKEIIEELQKLEEVYDPEADLEIERFLKEYGDM